jgi:hypothetical protein
VAFRFGMTAQRLRNIAFNIDGYRFLLAITPRTQAISASTNFSSRSPIDFHTISQLGSEEKPSVCKR